jgi:hypothetical protein
MENKQTAVEWLIQRIVGHTTLPIETINELILKSISMEKEQMFEFAEQVLLNTECSFTGLPFMTIGYDNIYEEIYGTK